MIHAIAGRVESTRSVIIQTNYTDNVEFIVLGQSHYAVSIIMLTSYTL